MHCLCFDSCSTDLCPKLTSRHCRFCLASAHMSMFLAQALLSSGLCEGVARSRVCAFLEARRLPEPFALRNLDVLAVHEERLDLVLVRHLCSAATHDVSDDSLFTAFQLPHLKTWLVRLEKETACVLTAVPCRQRRWVSVCVQLPLTKFGRFPLAFVLPR